ncbi:MAG: FAD-binding oxidoreductase [Myxococcota bacterium]|nr:FAD-binding oxidoreductase [Myxococcota bacterium]
MGKLSKIVSKGLDAAEAGAEVVRKTRKLIGGEESRAGTVLGEPAGRIIPGPPPIDPGDEESLDVWGFTDTAFAINERGNVTLTGSRYALSGQELPSLLPWVEDVMGVEVEPSDTHAPSYPPRIPKARESRAFKKTIKDFLSADQITQDPKQRLRHGHGHTQEEMYAIKYGKMERVPDMVVYPTAEDQVSALVAAALKHNVCLIPYGGGTSVTSALRCPSNEKRFIVSVDMRRMNRILWIDPINHMACIQAGAVGRHIVEQLAEHGFLMGHEPDSIEFSTLGGWIATHASGMKKNRYGNIEQLVLDVNVVTASGKLEKAMVAPRESIGIDPRQVIFGSEGALGIITQAVVKLFPLPDVQDFGSVLFPDFESGVAFMYDLTHEGGPPASVRLVDNEQFQFSMALKPASTGWRKGKSAVEKVVVTKLKGFEPDKMVACTLVFEGSREEVEVEQARVYRIAERHGGMKAGGANGERGYQLTFGIAYIRDFVMNHYVLAESFETSVPWSEALALCENVKRRVWEEHRRRELPGKPFITCRVTQVYDTGVCIYFYLAYYFKGVDNPSEVYAEIEHAAREEILASGGSLSHHHGVGKLRKDFMSEVFSETALRWKDAAKQAIDPSNVFGCANNQWSAETDDGDKGRGPSSITS